MKKSLEDLKRIRDEIAPKLAMRNDHNNYKVVVSMGTCGISAGARPVLNGFVEEVASCGLNAVMVTQSGCLGHCEAEPVVQVTDPNGNVTLYGNVKTEDVKVIVSEHIIKGNPVSGLLLNK